ncbi:MAG: trypsin-like serine protease [Bacteroidales bacterium]|nr:trypsin-like serine protease [Bacteroidales bacterium]
MKEKNITIAIMLSFFMAFSSVHLYAQLFDVDASRIEAVDSRTHYDGNTDDPFEDPDFVRRFLESFHRDGDRIVGGDPVNIDDFPWQVSMQLQPQFGGAHFCGGTIVDDQWLITASHCLVFDDNGDDFFLQPFHVRVRAGFSHLSSTTQGSYYNVSQIILHPSYNSNSHRFDIALVQISGNFNFSHPGQAKVGIVRQSDAAAGLTNPGVMGWVSGWGALSFGGSSPDQLRAVQVPIVGGSASYPPSWITPDMMLAGATGQDACQGDSGGPYVVPDGNGWHKLAGVVSWGNGCGLAGYPGVYARVSYFEDWLDQYLASDYTVSFDVRDVFNNPIQDAQITVYPDGRTQIAEPAFTRTKEGDVAAEYRSASFETEVYDASFEKPEPLPVRDDETVLLPGNWAQAGMVGTYRWVDADQNPLGWIFGNNTYGDQAVGMKFPVDNPYTITGAYFWIGEASEGPGDVHFRIYDYNGAVGSLIATKSVALNDIVPFPTVDVGPGDYLSSFFVEFDEAVEVTGDYLMAVDFGDLVWNAHPDGIGMASTLVGQGGGGLDVAYIRDETGAWVKATSYNPALDLDIGIFPVVSGYSGGGEPIVLFTDHNGVASFQATPGYYSFLAQKEGYFDEGWGFDVVSDNITVNVTMFSDSDMPQVYFTVDMTDAFAFQGPAFDPDLHSVYITGSFAGWAMPGTETQYMMQPLRRKDAQTFYENFEGFADFTTDLWPWTTIDVHGGNTWGANDFDFPIEGDAFAWGVMNPSQTDPPIDGNHPAFDGNKYLFSVGQTSAPAQENKWLISPPLTVTDASVLSFHAKSITAAYGLERIKVYVSTSGTDIADFDLISEGSYLQVPVEWTEFSFPLAAYAGQTIHFAIENVSHDAFILFVDAIEVSNLAGAYDENIYAIMLEVEPGYQQYKYFFIEDEPTWNFGEWGSPWDGYPDREIFVYGDMMIHDIWGVPDDPAEGAPVNFHVYDYDEQPLSNAMITVMPHRNGPRESDNAMKRGEHINAKLRSADYEPERFATTTAAAAEMLPARDGETVLLPGNWAMAGSVGTYRWVDADQNPVGWIFGNNTYGDQGTGMVFFVDEPYTIHGAYFWIGAAEPGEGDVHFRIYEYDDGFVGSVIATKSIPLNDIVPYPTGEGITPDQYMQTFYVEFDNPVDVGVDYLMAVDYGDLLWNAHPDGIGMASTLVGQGGGGLDIAYIRDETGAWVKATSYNAALDLDIGIFPVISGDYDPIEPIYLFTDENGFASFFADPGFYSYYVVKEGFYDIDGYFYVHNYPVDIFIFMGPYVDQEHMVTFMVDMTNAVVPGYEMDFDPDIHSVYITGSFVDWPMPGSDEAMMMHPVQGNGNLVFYEDFNGGLPAGWENHVVSGPTGFPGWEWTTTGAAYGGTLESSTAANGYMKLDSDAHGAPGSPEEANLISPPIDLSYAVADVVLSVEHMARTYGAAETRIYISTDDFATQTMIYEWQGGAMHDYNTPDGTRPDPAVVVDVFDITELAAGHSNVRIKFNWIGDWDYWWLLDDVMITATLDEEAPDTPLYYSITLPVMEGEQQYKYFLVEDEPTWEYGEWSGEPNRIIWVYEDVMIEDIWGVIGYTVGFNVYDMDYGWNIYDATITLGDITNDPGSYVFYGVPEGEYYVIISNPPCYLDLEGNVYISNNVTFNAYLQADFMPGDANGDGVVDVLDVILMANFFAGVYTGEICFRNADVNYDGIVNILDLIATVNLFVSGKTTPFIGLQSEDAHLYMTSSGIYLKSDGTLAGIEFEFSGELLHDLKLQAALAGFELVYTYEDGKIRAMLFSMDNKPIPAGLISLVTFNRDVDSLTWSYAIAGNLNADEVPVLTHDDLITDVDELTGINFKAYPNPATDVLWVQFNNAAGKAQVSLINIHGQVVKTHAVLESGHQQLSFDLSNLPSGIYMLKLEHNADQIIERIMRR